MGAKIGLLWRFFGGGYLMSAVYWVFETKCGYLMQIDKTKYG